jgi:hypothetical protein
VPGGGRLRLDRPERDVAHGFEREPVHVVDIDVLPAIRTGRDPFEQHARLGEPGADMPEQILRRPALLVVPGPLHLFGRELIDERADLAPAGLLRGRPRSDPPCL